ncbi:Holliday junction resolvase [Candidatus Woesearchaeota archaeon]|nr:MAG: Holliday junction resolvase [Candidatus Woesearchaeota archaeon]
MNRKLKGINAERELVHKFWEKGWPCVRVAGSGSSRYPSPDILAGNRERMVAIECKVTKGKTKYFPKEEILMLKRFCDLFGAEPWVGIKFAGEEWFFLSLDDLKDTGNCYLASLEIAKTKGLLAEELVGIFNMDE